MKIGGIWLSITGRLIFIIVLFIASYVFAMFQGGKVSWTIFYVMMPFLLYSAALFLYPIKTMNTVRTFQSKTIEKGGKLVVTISVSRAIPFPLLYTVLTDKWTEPIMEENSQHNHKHFFVFGFKRNVDFTYEIEHIPRGEHIAEGIEIEVSDFFGWIKKSVFYPVKDTILVYPNTVPMHYASMDAQFDRGARVAPYSLIKDTTMATGVRDYQAGDRVSWIHWKSFARTQTLMTKEFEDRQSEDLIVLLDGRESIVFESQVELCASIMEEATSHQATVSFISVGEETKIFPFIHSSDQFHTVFVHLAKLQPAQVNDVRLADSSVIESLSGSLIIITSNPDWAFIQSANSLAPSAKSIICFVVVEEKKTRSAVLQEQLRLLKSKGFKVHVVTQPQFADALMEVSA